LISINVASRQLFQAARMTGFDCALRVHCNLKAQHVPSLRGFFRCFRCAGILLRSKVEREERGQESPRAGSVAALHHRACFSLALTVILATFSAEAAELPTGNKHDVNARNHDGNPYPDGRPQATLRLDAKDLGVVLRHGNGPGQCDVYGARDVWVFEDGDTYYMHYDAAGPTGWLAALATSKDLLHWEKMGPVLGLGKPGEDDSKSASYGVTFKDAETWHMYYLGTPNTTPPPDRIPSFPYLTMKAKSRSPAGPWEKQREVVPFRCRPDTYYTVTASPGQILRHGGEYLMFFSAATDRPIKRTIGLARTRNLDGPWTLDPQPIVSAEEQIENTSLYYEQSGDLWFLFTNHIGLDSKHGEYTDAVWVYWSKDLNRWNARHKAIVLDGRNCSWSKKCIGLPSVVKFGQRLALLYDAPGGAGTSHMKRDVGLAWLELPLVPPKQ
jgi:predicted GH43/DUF377 family glycosyl hydrolase